MELRQELDRTTRNMIGGICPVGSRQCLTLEELETHVPPHILLQCYSCITLHKPSIRDLVRLYGQVQWGNLESTNEIINSHQSAGGKNNSTQHASSGDSKLRRNNQQNQYVAVINAKNGGNKKRKKRRKGTHEMVSLGTKSSRKPRDTASSKDAGCDKNATATPTATTTNNNSTTTTTTQLTKPFSTVQILRSLAVALQTIPAKKAALQWAEQQLHVQSNGADPHRLLGQWKQHFQRLELKATVASRKKERRKLPKQKRKDRARARKMETKKHYESGKEIERDLLERNFDMTSRVVYRPPMRQQQQQQQQRGNVQENSDSSDSDSEMMYQDDFEEDEDRKEGDDKDEIDDVDWENRSWSFMTEDGGGV